jgi:uncharacterized protein (TIGR02680 family)
MTLLPSTPESEASRGLPEPRRERWQPLRGGLVNVFKYDDQEFRYEDGRLILRGNNGTGKSRVLALQFPFLLDGEVSPHRLEPDGDPAKRVEWNLLMGRHTDRTGYTWAEFGRVGDEGAEYVTLGCGMHAVEGRGLAARWFFVTRRRVGRDLRLVTPSGYVLSRERLEEALGEQGRVFRDARGYREEVNRVLFGLDQRRYDALVDLLIQLRQPKLSRQLDERLLSAALSEALRPPSPDVLGPVAEAFRGLEEDRQALEHYTAASRGVQAFMREYRRYAGIAARRHARAVTHADNRYDARLRELRGAEDARAAAEARYKEACVEVDRLASEKEEAETRRRTLESSPEMRHARDLDRAAQESEERAREAARAEERLARAARAQQVAHQHCVDLCIRQADKKAFLEQALADGHRDAAAAGLGDLHASALSPLALPDGPMVTGALAVAQRLLDEAVSQRLAALRELVREQQRTREVEQRIARAVQALEERESTLADAREQQARAQDQHDQAGAALVAAARQWIDGLEEIALADAAGVLDALDGWCEAPEGASPVERTAAEARDRALARLYEQRAGLNARREEGAARVRLLVDERRSLASGHHRPPPPPYTRDPAARAERAGAPLWMLCDFRDDLAPEARAGLEAALEASGILDAWVTPDGSLVTHDARDTLLVPGTSPLPAETAHVGLWLLPCIDPDNATTAMMAESTVAAVLRHLGAGPGAGHIWVATDGHWQLGPLHGSWHKSQSEHIGESSREAARRRRLAELDAQIEQARRELADLESQLEELVARERRIRVEATAAPSGQPVQQAWRAVLAARAAVLRAQERVEEAAQQVAARREEAAAVLARRDALARDLGLADGRADTQPLQDALTQYRTTLARLWPAAQALRDVSDDVERARERLDAAREAEERAREDAAAARERAGAARAVYLALKETVGSTVEEVLRQLAEARQRLQALEREARAAAGRKQEAHAAHAVAASEITRAQAAVQDAMEVRQRALDAFAQFVATGLAGTASELLTTLPSGEVSVTRAVNAARQVEEVLTELPYDDGAWERSEKGIQAHIERLRQALGPQEHELGVTLTRGLCVVTAVFSGRACTMREFEALLAEEVTHRSELLSAKEREVIENHLSAEVALHLHQLLRDAETWVRDVNRELEARPTSTGMRLRFAWQPLDGEVPGLDEARKRLLRTDGTWTAAERAALGQFLQQRIQAERQRRETGTWQEHLSAALDYRAWHRFVVERYQDRVWKPLTRRTHGTGSGGEKALALTIPQFAAAAAHYSSARPTAPRLILLDEAFVGVDKAMRGHCMALLHAFDLDFVMTSEHEWGCYPTVPGVAICQLSTRPDVDAVGVTRWVWNGRERTRDDAVTVTE